jgi:cinnamyl-alcohol dehydrogenase
MEVTAHHTQTVAGWAAMSESGKVEPFVFQRR